VEPATGAGLDPMPRVTDMLASDGLLEREQIAPGDPAPMDLTRDPLLFPTTRATRLQNLARGDEGFLLAMGYSTQRGYANTHPFAAEIRFGQVPLVMEIEELGFAIEIGEIAMTECQLVNEFHGGGHGDDAIPPQSTRGY